jgi:hypothetical protein
MNEDQGEQQRRRISVSSRTIYWVITILLVTALIYAIFSTQLGQTALLICCGGLVLVVVIGLISERGMRRVR